MNMYGEYQIVDMPLSAGVVRSKVEAFLAENGLRLEEVDRYIGIVDTHDRKTLRYRKTDEHIFRELHQERRS